jgi:hypothetical protein
MKIAFPSELGRLGLSVGAFFLTLSALSWITLDRVKYIYLTSGKTHFAHDALAALTVSDFALLVVGAGTGIAVLLTGMKNRAAIRLCAGEDPTWLFVVTSAVLIWMGHAVLAPGLLVTGDAGTHVARISHLSAAVRSGESLYWDNYFFGGSTLLQFTGPLFHWIATAVTLLVGDATEAIKLTVSAARALAALFAYLLVRRLGGGRPASCLAALFYGGAFQLTYMEAIRSSFPQLVNFAAMPAILFCIECLWKRPAVLGAPAAGLALGAICLIGSHQPTALLFAGYAGLFVVARIAMDRRRIAALPGLCFASVMAGLGSVFFLVPFALERGMTADNFSTGSLVGLVAPDVASLHNFIAWGSAGKGPDYSTYLGLPLLLCVVFGGIAALARRSLASPETRQVWLLFCGLAILSLFVRGAYVRHNTFTLLFLSVAGAMGAELLIRDALRWAALPALLFMAVVLDAAPLAVQPWTRSDMGTIVAASESLARRAVDSRVMEVWYNTGQPDVSVGPDSSPLSYARIQMLSGPHKQDATPAHNAGAAVLRVAADDLKRSGSISPVTSGLLALSNIGWVVGTGANRPGLPPAYANTLPDPVLGSYWRIQNATPFVVSGHLEQVDRPSSFDGAPFWTVSFEPPTQEARDAIDAVLRFYARMGADPAARQAKTLLLPVVPTGDAWRADSGETPVARLLAYIVEPGRVHLKIESDRQGFIRLVHPMAATVHVTLDGVPVEAVADVESLIVLPIHAGVNAIDVTAEPSRLRQLCFWLTAVTALLLVLVLVHAGWRNCLRRSGGCKRAVTLSD